MSLSDAVVPILVGFSLFVVLLVLLLGVAFALLKL